MPLGSAEPVDVRYLRSLYPQPQSPLLFLPSLPSSISRCVRAQADRFDTVCGVGAAMGMEAEAAIEPTKTSWEWTILTLS